MFKVIAIILVVVFIVLPYMYRSSSITAASSDATQGQSGAQAVPQPYSSRLDQLEQAEPYAISPKGEIAEIFSIGGKFTDLQRQLKFKEIQGKIIEWRLPVFDVKQSGEGYRISTLGYGNGQDYIGAFLHITPRSEEDRRYVERIKTGDFIKVKGIVEDVFMRNLVINPAIIFDNERLPRQLLENAYGRYIPKYDCYHVVTKDQNNSQQHCMRLGRVDKIKAGNVDRLYVLALGEVVDDEGKPNRSHVDTGMVGAFVADIQNGQAQVVASNSKMLMGSFGVAPDEWKFVKLGPGDYWGWQSATGDCHWGECWDAHIVLAPYGKSIKDLAGFGGQYSDRDSSRIRIAMTIDSSPTSAKVYPLLLEVTEERDEEKASKIVSKNVIKVPFDEKNWRWKYPKQ